MHNRHYVIHRERDGSGKKLSSVASSFLRVAVGHRLAGQLAAVGGVRASSVLHRARALQSSGLVDEGCSIDGKWAVAGGLNDRGSSSSKGAGEGLDIGVGALVLLGGRNAEGRVEGISCGLSSCCIWGLLALDDKRLRALTSSSLSASTGCNGGSGSFARA